jgi:hypothetical protein
MSKAKLRPNCRERTTSSSRTTRKRSWSRRLGVPLSCSAGARTETSTLPSITSSPGESSLRSTRTPPVQVPFVDRRSSTTTVRSDLVNRACSRERLSSAMRTCEGGARPIVTGTPGLRRTRSVPWR